MPLPRSRFGKAVLMVIALCLLAAYAVAVARAQELPTGTEGGAQNPDNAVCRAAEDIPRFRTVINDSQLRQNIDSIRQRLAGLCSSSPSDERIRGGGEAGWISMVDNTIESLLMSLGDRMNRPISARDRPVLRDLMFRVARFQQDFELTRISAYQAVRTETREVVKTVEVPVRVPCPAPEPPMAVPVRSACEDALHDSLWSWYNGLYRKPDEIFGIPIVCGSGCEDEEWANGVRADINRVSPDSSVASYAMGWLASYRAMRRDRHGVVDARYERVAADMRAKLGYCGMTSEER